MKNAKWYAQVNSQRIGPVFAQELQKMLENRQISEETYVYTKGMENWMQLKDSPFHRQMLASVFDIKNDETPIAAKPKKKAAPEKPATAPAEKEQVTETVQPAVFSEPAVEEEKEPPAKPEPVKDVKMTPAAKTQPAPKTNSESIFSPERFPLTKKTLLIYVVVSLLLTLGLVYLSEFVVNTLIDNGVISFSASVKDTEFGGYDEDADFFYDEDKDSAFVDNSFTSTDDNLISEGN